MDPNRLEALKAKLRAVVKARTPDPSMWGGLMDQPAEGPPPVDEGPSTDEVMMMSPALEIAQKADEFDYYYNTNSPANPMFDTDTIVKYYLKIPNGAQKLQKAIDLERSKSPHAPPYPGPQWKDALPNNYIPPVPTADSPPAPAAPPAPVAPKAHDNEPAPVVYDENKNLADPSTLSGYRDDVAKITPGTTASRTYSEERDVSTPYDGDEPPPAPYESQAFGQQKPSVMRSGSAAVTEGFISDEAKDALYDAAGKGNAAISKEAVSLSGIAGKQADLAEQYQKDSAAQLSAQKTEAEEQEKRYQEESRRLASELDKEATQRSYDPGRFMNSMDTIQKIAIGISAGLGGFVEGFTSGRVKNSALEWLDRAAERDMVAQSKDREIKIRLLERKQAQLTDAQKTTLDTMYKRQARERAELTLAQAKAIERLAEAAGSSTKAAQLYGIAADLKMKAAEIHARVTAGNTQYTEEVKDAILGRGNGRGLSSAQRYAYRDKIAEASASVNMIKDFFDEYIALGVPGKVLFDVMSFKPIGFKLGESIFRPLLTRLSPLVRGGVLDTSQASRLAAEADRIRGELAKAQGNRPSDFDVQIYGAIMDMAGNDSVTAARKALGLLRTKGDEWKSREQMLAQDGEYMLYKMARQARWNLYKSVKKWALLILKETGNLTKLDTPDPSFD